MIENIEVATKARDELYEKHATKLVVNEALGRQLVSFQANRVKSWKFCNFLQASFLLYRSMNITSSACSSSGRRYSRNSSMSR